MNCILRVIFFYVCIMAVGYDTFYRNTFDLVFIIKNISDKALIIFNVKINPGSELDLMQLSYISEADIRNSLIKGVLKNKLKNNEISIISSNITLTSYSDDFTTQLFNSNIFTSVKNESSIANITSDLTITNQQIILANAVSNSIDITLPDLDLVSNTYSQISVKKIDSTDNIVNIYTAKSAQKIDLNDDIQINVPMTCLRFFSDESNWWII